MKKVQYKDATLVCCLGHICIFSKNGSSLVAYYKHSFVEKDMSQSIGTSIKNMKIYIKDNGKRKILYSYEEWMLYK